MKRAIVALTPAEQSFLRGAIRSYSEDMSIAGLSTGSEAVMSDRLFTKINAATLVDLTPWAKATVRRIAACRQAGYDDDTLAFELLKRIGDR